MREDKSGGAHRPARLIRRASAILSLTVASAAWGTEPPLESPVCGDTELREAAGWRDMAERNGRRLVSVPGITPASFDVNGVHLTGYRIDVKSLSGGAISPVGTLLVLQGNAMLAEQIVEEFIPYARAGLDVYIVDFRGFGDSEGRPFLRATLADFASIAKQLARASNGRLFLYGMSFGAGMALKLINDGVVYRAAVIDATPSRFLRVKLLCVVPWNVLKCPEEYQPENNVPKDVQRILFLHGSADSIIRLCDAEALRTRVEGAGGQFQVLEGFAHPMLDDQPRRVERHRTVLKFFSRYF